MLSTETLALAGFIAGLLGGALLGGRKIGCAAMALVPIAALFYVDWSLAQEVRLSSTSGLNYLFVPGPPTIAAMLGYGCVAAYRNWKLWRDF